MYTFSVNILCIVYTSTSTTQPERWQWDKHLHGTKKQITNTCDNKKESHNPTIPKTHHIRRCLFEVTTFHTGIQHTAIGHLGGSTRCTKLPGPRRPDSVIPQLHWLQGPPPAFLPKPWRTNGIFVAWNDEAEADVEKKTTKRQIPPPPKKKRDQKGARCILQKLKTSNHSNELNRKQNLSAVPVALAQYFQLGHRPGVVHWLLQFYRFLWAWGHS